MKTLLKNASIVDKNNTRRKVNVLIENSTIKKVSKDKIDCIAKEYELQGYTLMPGFINTHVHLMDCFDGFNEENLKKWLCSGITSLRDEGILSDYTAKDSVDWREKCRKSFVFPSFDVCGKFIAAPDGYGGVAPLGVTTEQEAREAVKMQIDFGVDHIKIALDSGYDDYSASLPLLPIEILFSICDETHKWGKKVSAHVTAKDKLEILLKAGIDEAAHTCYDTIPDATLEYMVKHNVCMTPTLSVYGEISTNFGAPFLYKAMDNTKRFVDIGGIIGLGNDYIEPKQLWSPVGMPMMEIELLLKAGLTMHQVITAATTGGATILNKSNYGKIEENCIANLIAVKGDPYSIPLLLSCVNFVMNRGVVVKDTK